MEPRDLQAVMRVNSRWYSEANTILCNKITSLLHGKVLYSFFASGGGGEETASLNRHVLPPSFEAQKLVQFYSTASYRSMEVSVSLILQKEGLDGFPEGVWRDNSRLLRACLWRPGGQVYCRWLSKLCPTCSAEFIWPGRRKVKLHKGEKLVHVDEDGTIRHLNEWGSIV
jgi:hypothetical protein